MYLENSSFWKFPCGDGGGKWEGFDTLALAEAEWSRQSKSVPTFCCVAPTGASRGEQPARAVLKPPVEVGDDHPGGRVGCGSSLSSGDGMGQGGRPQPLGAVSPAGSGGAEHRQVSPSVGAGGVTPLTTLTPIRCYLKTAILEMCRQGKIKILALRKCHGTQINAAMQKKPEEYPKNMEEEMFLVQTKM